MLFSIFILYILPLIVVSSFVYFEEDVETLGDFLERWWVILIPGINLIVAVSAPVICIINFISCDKKLVEFWIKLMNKKIK
jgi:hypothetical protein